MMKHLFHAMIVMGSLAIATYADTPVQDASSPALVFADGTDDLQVNLRVTPDTVEVGVPVELVLTAAGKAAGNARFPQPMETMGAFDVLSFTPIKSATLGPDARGLRILLSSYEIGEQDIPALEIRVGDETLTLGPATVEITTLVGAEAGPEEHRDIMEAVAVPISPLGWGWLLGGGVLVAGIIGLLVWWLLTRERSAEPEEPEDTTALKRLEELERENLPGRGQVQQYFYRLTDIARAYIERRYLIHAPDRTTQEFIVETQRHHELDPEHATMLGRLLKSADMVKFAGDRPAAADCVRAMQYVRTFVQESGARPALITEESEPDFGADTDHPLPERMTAMGLDDPRERESIGGRIER